MIRNILELISDDLQLDIDRDEVREIVDNFENKTSDFYQEIDGQEYRFILDDYIDDIAEEEIKELVQECYLDGLDTDKYWWIAIDWKQTAENCINADGYGHHFGRYDGNEYEVTVDSYNQYHVFRTN